MNIDTLNANVERASASTWIGGCRMGTAEMSRDQARVLFGLPHEKCIDGDPTDGYKVSDQWQIDTPRGPVHLYHYWWNGPADGALDRRTVEPERRQARALALRLPAIAGL